MKGQTRSEVRGLKPLGYWWYLGKLQLYSSGTQLLQNKRAQVWATLFFSFSTHFQFAEGTTGLCPDELEAGIVLPSFPLQQLTDYYVLKGFTVTLIIDAQNKPLKGKLISLLQGARRKHYPFHLTFCCLLCTQGHTFPASIRRETVTCCTVHFPSGGQFSCEWTFHHHFPSSNCS